MKKLFGVTTAMTTLFTADGAPDVQLTVRSRLTFREAFSLMLQEL